MAVISINIIQSSEEIVSGIPRTIAISTNIPASIFYTLDGSVPTLFSQIYTGLIYLPTDKLSIILNVLATNGVDFSPIITESYATDILNNARLPHSAVDGYGSESIPNLYPFGTSPNQPTANFLSPSISGVTVDNPDVPSTPTGFDGYGNPNAFTDEKYNIENYQIVYPTTNAQGESKRGIGTLPGNVTIKSQEPVPENTEQFTNLFDPRAFVIFQDFDKENPDDPPQINRQFFTLEDPSRARDGNYYYTSGLDAPPTNGTFLRSHYNPRDNTMNYYYLDTWANKWIISKQQYQPSSGNFDGNIATRFISNRQPGSKYVHEWRTFARRVLF